MTSVRTRLVALGDQPVVAWKNGGGTTRQVAIEPEGATVAGAFDWRISRAQVAADGPFSLFLGVDRSLWLLAGPGIELAFAARSVRLDRPFARCDFRGEDEVAGRLLGGPIEDLNVMAARERVAARSEVLELGAGEQRALALPAGTTVIVALTAPLALGDRALAAGDALRLDAARAHELHLHAAARAMALVATFTPR